MTEDGVNLEWIPSSSNDVVGYELEILLNKELVRKVYIEKRDSLTRYTYTDKNLEPANIYTYVAITIDESGLRSEPSTPVNIKSGDFKAKTAIDNLTALTNEKERSVLLNWSYSNDEPIKRFILYRAVEGASFVTYKSLGPEDSSFKDNMIRPGVKYEYTIKAVYNTGKQTPFSNIVSSRLE